MAVKKTDKPQDETVSMVGVKSVPTEIIQKLQTIASTEGISFNQVYNIAFVKLIEAYEAKNGKVKVRKKGQGLEGI